MALTKTLWTPIINLVTTGQDVRENLGMSFNNVDDAIDQIDLNTESIGVIDERVVTLENYTDNAISIATLSPIEAQTLIANTPEKLEWMTTAIVSAGGTSISYDIPTDNILVQEAGIYKLYGVVSGVAPINDIVDIELYIDNLPTGFSSSCVGRGDGSSVTFTYSFMTPFAVNDDINLYITSTGTSFTVQSASVTVEKTKY